MYNIMLALGVLHSDLIFAYIMKWLPLQSSKHLSYFFFFVCLIWSHAHENSFMGLTSI